MILVIGDVMLDRYLISEVTGVATEAPVPRVKVKKSNDYPGGAANVASNIASLGHSVSLLGLTADDENKEFLDKKLKDLGVNTLLLDKLKTTTTKLRVIAKDNQVIRVDFEDKLQENNLLLSVSDIENNQDIHDILKKTNIVVFSDYAKGALFDIENLTNYLTKNFPKIKILVDPKDNNSGKYKNLFLLKPNYKEAQEILGECASIDELSVKSQKFITDNNIENLLVTLGKDGMILYRQGKEPYHVASRANEVFDVTGAGDTVLSSLACALEDGLSLEESLDLATVAASIAVSKLGTVCLDKNFFKEIRTSKTVNIEKMINKDSHFKLQEEIASLNKKLYIFEDGINLIDGNLINSFKSLKKDHDVLWVKLNKDLDSTENNIHDLDAKIEILKSLKSVDGILVV